jgi:hypothetical protein
LSILFARYFHKGLYRLVARLDPPDSREV